MAFQGDAMGAESEGDGTAANVDEAFSSCLQQEIEKRVVDVSIREEVIQTAGETTGTPEMPGLDDGGETRLLQAAGATTIRSDGPWHAGYTG